MPVQIVLVLAGKNVRKRMMIDPQHTQRLEFLTHVEAHKAMELAKNIVLKNKGLGNKDFVFSVRFTELRIEGKNEKTFNKLVEYVNRLELRRPKKA